jgi:hypothetical protein
MYIGDATGKSAGGVKRMTRSVWRNLVLVAFLAVATSAYANPRRYAIVLEALGRSFEISAQSLDDLEASLSGTGTNPREAQAAILAVIRNVRTQDSTTGEIVMLARDIGAIMGTGIVAETGQLVSAITGGYDAMERYGFARNVLSADDAAAMRLMQQHGDHVGMANLLLDRFKLHFGGKYEQLRSPDPAALRAEECDAHAEENKRQFDTVLRALPTRHIYATAAQSGKRVQALGGAKKLHGGDAGRRSRPGDRRADGRRLRFGRRALHGGVGRRRRGSATS